MAKRHCCDTMTSQVQYKCDQHPNPYDCPDNVILYSEKEDTYDLIIHDGIGYGVGGLLGIAYCPFCGANLETVRKVKKKLRFGTRSSERFRAIDLDEDVLAQKYPLRKELLARQRAQVASIAGGILAGEIGLAAGAKLLERLERSVTSDPGDPDFIIFNMLVPRLDMGDVADSEKGQAQAEELYAEYYVDAICDACRRLVSRFGS